MAEKWDGKTKTTEKLTFTLNYADGSQAEIEKGVLFSINDKGLMDVHVGVDKLYELFGVARCLLDLVRAMGWENLFYAYMKEDFGEAKEHREIEALLSAGADYIADAGEKASVSCDYKNDLISRREAIDAMWKALHDYLDKTEKQFLEYDELDIGDWVEHRIFVENMSDIDRKTILELPPAQPEYSLDEWCMDCKEYDHEKYSCTRFNRVIRETVKEVQTGRWVLTSETLPPKEPGEYLCTCIWAGKERGVVSLEWGEASDYVKEHSPERVYDGWAFGSSWEKIENADEVVAWMPLPKPWEGGKDG